MPVLRSHWQRASASHGVRVWYLSEHFSTHTVPLMMHCGSLVQSVVAARVVHDATQVPVVDENMHCASLSQSSAVA